MGSFFIAGEAARQYPYRLNDLERRLRRWENLTIVLALWREIDHYRARSRSQGLRRDRNRLLPTPRLHRLRGGLSWTPTALALIVLYLVLK